MKVQVGARLVQGEKGENIWVLSYHGRTGRKGNHDEWMILMCATSSQTTWLKVKTLCNLTLCAQWDHYTSFIVRFHLWVHNSQPLLSHHHTVRFHLLSAHKFTKIPPRPSIAPSYNAGHLWVHKFYLIKACVATAIVSIADLGHQETLYQDFLPPFPNSSPHWLAIEAVLGTGPPLTTLAFLCWASCFCLHMSPCKHVRHQAVKNHLKCK